MESNWCNADHQVRVASLGFRLRRMLFPSHRIVASISDWFLPIRSTASITSLRRESNRAYPVCLLCHEYRALDSHPQMCALFGTEDQRSLHTVLYRLRPIVEETNSEQTKDTHGIHLWSLLRVHRWFIRLCWIGPHLCSLQLYYSFQLRHMCGLWDAMLSWLSATCPRSNAGRDRRNTSFPVSANASVF